jgi:hypothetical protein
MYSRSTDRGGRRIKLPPGYDGNAFHRDTGEIRPIGMETEMKIHSPAASEEHWEAVETRAEPEMELPAMEREEECRKQPQEEVGGLPVPSGGEKRAETESFLAGLLSHLGSEDWLLFLVILLLVADGSDAWDLILLLGLLLAVK